MGRRWWTSSRRSAALPTTKNPNFRMRSIPEGLLCPGYSRQVLLFEDPAVVQVVSSNDVRQRTYRHLALVRYAAPLPSGSIQSGKERNRCSPNFHQLLGQIGQGAFRKTAILHVVILLKTGERRPIAAGNAQCPIGEDPFAVGNVPDDFFHRPLVRGVAKISLALAAGPE